MIFAGALSVHQDLYTYSVHQEAEERRLTPTEVCSPSTVADKHLRGFIST